MLRLAHRLLSQPFYNIEERPPELLSGTFIGAPASPRLTSSIRDVIRGGVIIIGDDIARGMPDEVTDDKADYPCPVPPFASCFIEHLITPCTEPDEPGRRPSMLPGFLATFDDIKMVGWLVGSLRRSDLGTPRDFMDRWLAAIADSDARAPFIEMANQFRENERGGWLNWERPFMVAGDRNLRLPVEAMTLLDESGNITESPYVIFGGGVDESLQGAVHWSHTVMWRTLSMLNCRNVELVDETGKHGPRAKWLRRMKQPEIKYHVLKVQVGRPRKLREGDDESGAAGAGKALHVCRGHFRTYDENSPGLFGRLHGRYWIPQHARGDEKLGEVKKDYQVEV